MNNYELLFICSYAFNAIVLAFLAFFVLLKNPKNIANRTYSFYSLAISFWSFFSILMIKSKFPDEALFWDRLCILGVIFIPTTFFHFTCSFLKLSDKGFLIKGAYALAILFSFLNFTPFFVEKTAPAFLLRNFTVPGVGYYIFLIYYTLIVLWCIYLIFFEFNSEKSILRKQQLKFLLWSTIFGYAGGAFNFNLVLKIPPYEIVPFGNVCIGLYGLCVAYAMVRYQLLDIKIIFTRASIFVFVYALVLGIPLWVGYKILGNGLWLIPTVFMAFFCTVGPFIYLYLQKRAEDKILQEQRRYQATLRQAATGMGRVKQLKKLLNLVVYVVTRAVHLEHTLVYLRDDKAKQYILSAFKSRRQSNDYLEFLPFSSVLVGQLTGNHNPINFEEFQQKNKDQKIQRLGEIEQEIIQLKGELVLPIHIEDKLLAFIVFGKKESGKAFTDEDLTVFSSLTNQIALAIENAQFYEEVKRTQEQLFQAEKMATIGTMADGLSHQINNRFHAMGFIAGDALDTIKITKDKGVPDNYKETFDDLERAFTRVQENVVQGGEIVQGLLRYTRKGDAGLAEVDFDAVLKSAFEMAQFKIKTSELKVVRDFDENLPKLKANFTQLQEVFFNLIDNAYDAMMQRKTEKVEIGFEPTLLIRARPQGNFLEIIVEDNGIGVKDDDREKLFTPFFTTKLSSKKGTGLGLYVIRKIIEENHGGSVVMTSRYMIGTKMKIELPVVF